MKLPRYPKYKDSGVKWLGQVPEHWGILPIKRDVKFITSGSRGWAENYADEGDMFIRIGNLTRHGIGMDLTDVQRVLVPSGTEGVRTMVKPGDVLFSITAYLGSVAVVPDDLDTAFVSQHIALVRLKKKRLLPKWVAYLTSSDVGRAYLDASGYGGTKIQLSLSDVAGLITTAPPLEEQAAVIDFLDLETKKIEALIAEQRRMIELLREKRQAIITQAVTKGLNPDAAMKPSGVKWLGNVPTSWKICLLKRAFRSMEYGISDAVGLEGSIAILRMGNIVSGKIDYADLKYIDAVDQSLLLQEGDLLYNRTNSLDQIGKVGLFQGDVDGQFSFASYLVRLRTVSDSLPQFFAYLLNTENILGLARASAFVAIGQCNLNPSRYGRIIVAIPPQEEQVAIVRYLEKATATIDSLVADASRTIDILQERCSALISAAVTGALDVRNCRPEEARAVCQ